MSISIIELTCNLDLVFKIWARVYEEGIVFIYTPQYTENNNHILFFQPFVVKTSRPC